MSKPRSSRPRRRSDFLHHDIPGKANRILHIILVAMALIVVRIWYLSVIQYDQKVDESRKPQRKVVIEPAIRATIRDRFNLPLAINRTSYQAAILYSQIRDIPAMVWQKDETGAKVRVYKRKEYIKQLADLLGRELQLDPERIEDLIYAKASYYAQVPFVLKDDLDEKEYYRLKMLEKEWPGIHMRSLPKRFYPRGQSAADIIGYMGAINRQEYEKILHEMNVLEQFIGETENGVEAEPPYGVQNTTQARKRLRDLQEKAYTLHDHVGKTGIESIFEEQLRGFYGKKSYYSDSKGNYLWELPGSRSPLPGHRILLTISAELQEYAEQLLAQNEEFRVVRKTAMGSAKKTELAQKNPWIKGGAIVAMEPHTGEVLVLASYPRIDPNDFISSNQPEEQKNKRQRINRWFENESYLAQVWDLQQPLERERYDPLLGSFYEEKRWLAWSAYLDVVLPKNSPLREGMERINTLKKALELQNLLLALGDLLPDYEPYTLLNLLYSSDPHIPHRPLNKAVEKTQLLEEWEKVREQALPIKKALDPYLAQIPHNYDKVLAVDLCRLVVSSDDFSPTIFSKVSSHSLEDYRQATGALIALTGVVKGMSKELFHDIDFADWRKAEEKNFLKQKRLEEKTQKTYPKPYIDYFDQQEIRMFNTFWEEAKWPILTALLVGEETTSSGKEINEQLEPYLTYFRKWQKELKGGAHQALPWHGHYAILKNILNGLSADEAAAYLMTMRSYYQLNRPLLGRYKGLRETKEPLEKHLAATFYPVYGYGYGRSHAYRQATIQGSLFKLVTAYEALIQNYKKLGGKPPTLLDLNPLIISDQEFFKGNARFLGYTEDGKPIPQLYKGGRLPRSLAHKNTGRVDLVRALEVSSNPYFSMLAGDCLEDPADLAKASRQFGYGQKTGIQLAGEIPGKVPDDLATNRTGLYAMAIGQHSLVVTPLQTAVMLSTIANGGKVLQPKIVSLTAGRQPMRDDDQIPLLPSFPFHNSLRLIGIDFPVFTGAFSQNQEDQIKNYPTVLVRELPMPEMVRKILLKGLHASVQRTFQESLTSLTQLYKQYPEAIQEFKELKDQLLGKTSTSESVEQIDLDLEEGTNIYTHVWFGSISYDKTEKGKSAFIFKDEFGKPELVVVVYLRYGGYGKEAAPLAAQIVKKWREIRKSKG